MSGHFIPAYSVTTIRYPSNELSEIRILRNKKVEGYRDKETEKIKFSRLKKGIYKSKLNKSAICTVSDEVEVKRR